MASDVSEEPTVSVFRLEDSILKLGAHVRLKRLWLSTGLREVTSRKSAVLVTLQNTTSIYSQTQLRIL